MYIYLLMAGVSTLFSLLVENHRKFEITFSSNEDIQQVCSYEYTYRYTQYMGIPFLFSFLPMFLLSALRYDVGTDYMYTYTPTFIEMLTDSSAGYREIGINFIIRFIQLFTTEPQWFFVVTSFIYNFFVFLSIYRYSPNRAFSILLCLFSCIYFISLNNVRQSCAAAILLFAFSTITEKKPIPFLALVLLASLFHLSSIIFIIVYPLCNLRFYRQHYLIYSIIFFAFIFVGSNLFISIIRLTKYSYFLDSYLTTGRITYTYILHNLVIMAVTYLILKDGYRTNRNDFCYLVIQTISTLVPFFSFVIPSSELISRLDLYFLTYQVLLIPYLISRLQSREKRILVGSSLGIYMFLYMYYTIVIRNNHAVLPYQWIFGNY